MVIKLILLLSETKFVREGITDNIRDSEGPIKPFCLCILKVERILQTILEYIYVGIVLEVWT